MNRINNTLQCAGRRKLMVPFFTVGYPDYDTSLELVRVSVDAGADMVELGMPFSDPMADGPEIQFSSHVALEKGISQKRVLSAVGAIRAGTETPLILMGYYNPVFAFGVGRFVYAAKRAGADGFIIPDLTVEEAGEFKSELDRHGLSSVFLVAPTTSPGRLKLIDRMCSDFVYAVTVTGVTGIGRKFDRTTDRYMQSLKETLRKPCIAGFGVSSPDSARRLCRYADGVVIGSALIRVFRQARNKREGLRGVSRLLKSIRNAIS